MRVIKGSAPQALTDKTAHSVPEKGYSDILASAPDLLTIEETCKVLRIGVTTGRAWCREGMLPATKCGDLWRVPKAWLIEWLEAGRK